MLIRESLSAAELNVLQDNNCPDCCPTASCTRILESFKRCSFITHFSFASRFLFSFSLALLHKSSKINMRK